MRPLPIVPVLASLLFLVVSSSGCLGTGDAEPLDADPAEPSGPAESPESPAPSGEPVPAGGARLPNATGVLVQHFEGSSEYGETVLIGWGTSLGRGTHVADVQVPHDATALQFELRHDATLDVDPYLLAPRNPCGGADGGAGASALTGYVQDEEGFYVDRDDGALVRLDAEVLERHACERSCRDVRSPEYGKSCRTWQVGFRVDSASAPFTWEAALTVAVGVPLEEGYRALA